MRLPKYLKKKNFAERISNITPGTMAQILNPGLFNTSVHIAICPRQNKYWFFGNEDSRRAEGRDTLSTLREFLHPGLVVASSYIKSRRKKVLQFTNHVEKDSWYPASKFNKHVRVTSADGSKTGNAQSNGWLCLFPDQGLRVCGARRRSCHARGWSLNNRVCFLLVETWSHSPFFAWPRVFKRLTNMHHLIRGSLKKGVRWHHLTPRTEIFTKVTVGSSSSAHSRKKQVSGWDFSAGNPALFGYQKRHEKKQNKLDRLLRYTVLLIGNPRSTRADLC
jgi:hypothetical protein